MPLPRRSAHVCGSGTTLATAQRCFFPSAPLCRSKFHYRSPPTGQVLPATVLEKSAPITRKPLNLVHFAAMSVRSIIRKVGPTPLSKLTSYVADEYFEILDKENMSLLRLIETHPNYLIAVHLPGSIIIALDSDVRKQFKSERSRQLGVWVMALLSAAHHLGGQPAIAALRLSSPNPSVYELCNALARWTVINPAGLETFLRSHTDTFAVNPIGRQVRLLLLKSWGPEGNHHRSQMGQMSELQAMPKPQEASRFAMWLRTVVPSQYHVPLSHVLQRIQEQNLTEVTFGTATPTLDQIKRQFQQLPRGFADVRAFGDAPNTVFIRVIDPEPLLLDSGVSTYGGGCAPPELETAQHNPTQLAHDLAQAIEHYAGQSELTRARVVKGLEVSRLRDYVPAALMRRLEKFYGFSEADDPRVCILMLDRLRHEWEVRLGDGVVRPWSFLSTAEMPSSLTLQTSPAPRILLHCQHLLLECGPQPPVELYKVLPSDLKATFMEIYGETQARENPDDDAAEQQQQQQQPDEAVIEAAVQNFLRPHSLFFFTQDGYVHSSRTPSNTGNTASGAAGAKQSKESRAPSAELRGAAKRSKPSGESTVALELKQATEMRDLIPRGQMVLADTIRKVFNADAAVRSSRRCDSLTVRREFFDRFPLLFTKQQIFAFDKLVISRAGDTLEDSGILAPRMNTITHVVKFMALLSVNSTTDAALTRRLPLDGRTLLKSIGTAVDLAEQLPMWFAVQRDESNFGASLIRYIGPLAKTKRSPNALKPHPRGVLTRKVPNDPFADIAPDNVVDGEDEWNDDWNEDDDTFGRFPE